MSEMVERLKTAELYVESDWENAAAGMPYVQTDLGKEAATEIERLRELCTDIVDACAVALEYGRVLGEVDRYVDCLLKIESMAADGYAPKIK